MTSWKAHLRADPVPWLLDTDSSPPVRHLALAALFDQPAGHPAVEKARHLAMSANPIVAILNAQHELGYWEKPGPGYATKYRGTVWQLIFLDQLGADAADPRIRAACAYVLEHSQAATGGFAASGNISSAPPPESRVIHCLNGNLLRALLGFGWLEDPRVQRAIEWEARAITGEPPTHYVGVTSRPGFRCTANDGQPCAWGATKALLALARVPVNGRTSLVQRAIDQGAEFLLSTDVRSAMYPTRLRDSKPSPLWFRVGFPSGYVADVLQVVEALCELGYARDARLSPALEWLLSKQDAHGRCRNENAYTGRTWVDFERQGRPSKWVTLRACRVLRTAYG